MKWRRRCEVHAETTLERCAGCRDYFADDPAIDAEPTVPSTRPGPTVLIRFPHGFGDTVQLTVVLEHFRRLRPELGEIAVECKIGCHSALKGYASRFYLTDRGHYAPAGAADWDLSLPWYEPDASYEGTPATKAEKCLREMFNITPRPEWCNYRMPIGREATAAAVRYYREIGAAQAGERFRVVLLHYKGNTSTWNKDLSDETARAICDAAIALGFVPVVLDWQERCPFVDQRAIFCPGVEHPIWERTGTGDAERIAALIEAATLYVGIDSGPDHVAGACSTPSIIVWRGHHPLHYFGTGDQVLHLVPEHHAELIRGDRDVGLAAFEKLYRYEVYQDVTVGAVGALRKALPAPAGPLAQALGYWIRSDNLAQDLVIIRDVDDDDCYQVRRRRPAEPRAELVVDVGAHIGVFSRIYHGLNPDATIVAVEACPENHDALDRNLAELPGVLTVHGALTYEPGRLGLLNSVWPDCRSTGGSTVVPLQRLTEGRIEGEYRHDLRPLRKWTLEEIARAVGFDRIGLLKMDCEGSEFSILEGSPMIAEGRVDRIVGEFHDVERFRALIRSRFSDWTVDYKNTNNGLGLFWMTSPAARRARR